MSSEGEAFSPCAAVLTPRGRGAVATIGFHGSPGLLEDQNRADACPLFRSASGQRLADADVGRILYGDWSDEQTTEEVVLARVAEFRWEIHCHGGEAAVRRILQHLTTAGCVILSWQAWRNRFQSQLSIEYEEQLSRASTARTAGLLLQQSQGHLHEFVSNLLSATFPPNEVIRRLDRVLCWSRFGQHLTEPWSIVLTGRPNAGKSSLTNALLGYSRSIVSSQPGTTRDVITGETAFEGWPFRFVDTAGLRDQAEELEADGIQRAKAQVHTADCHLLLFDTSQPPHEEDLRFLQEWPDALRIAHKSDLSNVWGDRFPAEAISVSSLTGEGLENLTQEILKTVIPSVPEADQPIPVTERQRVLLKQAREAATRNDDEMRNLLKELLGQAD